MNGYRKMTEAWRDIEYWKGLAPGMHVESSDFLTNQKVFAIDEAGAQSLRSLIIEEGYIQTPPPDWNLPISEMASVVGGLRARHVPEAFCFMYDEFWCLFYKLNKIIEALLGPEFARLPDFWAWKIDPNKSESGWAPHRDRGYKALFEDRSPKSVTVWIPLTESTPLNGCMYVVPGNRDPT